MLQIVLKIFGIHLTSFQLPNFPNVFIEILSLLKSGPARLAEQCKGTTELTSQISDKGTFWKTGIVYTEWEGESIIENAYE